MTRKLELYVQRTDGTSYCEATYEDDEPGREAIDRLAFDYMARPSVVSVTVWPRESGERTGGYRRSRRIIPR